MVFKKSLRLCALDESSLSIGRVKDRLNFSSKLPDNVLSNIINGSVLQAEWSKGVDLSHHRSMSY